ncbi:hypothetical protein [Streptomyces sp. NPDC091278]|uniref:hypothetical protein n=1 Tax=Streptomyces sp. NPDC091278 TaxID=3155301 RepID=UPI003450F496
MNVQVRANDPNPGWRFARPRPPGRGPPKAPGDTGTIKLSRRVSWFSLAFGVWSWFIWITFSM